MVPEDGCELEKKRGSGVGGSDGGVGEIGIEEEVK